MIRSLLLALVLTGAASAAHAQQTDPTPDRTITLTDAIDLAQQQSIALRRAQISEEFSEIAVSSARNAYLPNADASGSVRQSYGRSFDQVTGRLVNETIESVGANVGLGYTLFDGTRRASLRQAEAELRATELTTERIEQDLVFQVATSFLNVISATEQVDVQQEALDQQVLLLEQVEGLIAGGLRPASEVFQQQAQVAQARLSVVNAVRDRQLAEANLIQLLQLDPFLDYSFVIPELPDLSDAELTAEAFELRGLIETAYERRSDLSALETDIEAAETGISIAQAGRLPRVSASAGYGTSWTSAAEVFVLNDAGQIVIDPETGLRVTERVSLLDQLDQQRGGSIGLSLSVPLFDAFRTRDNVQRAQVQAQSARINLEDQRQQIATQVRQAILDYRAAGAQVAFSRVQVEAAQQAFQAAQQRYAAGAATLFDVQQAQTLLVNAQSNLVSAQYRFVFQEKLIDYYIGTIDTDRLSFD
jgi:outer membrane protein